MKKRLLYKCYKGDLVEKLGIGNHTESGDRFIVYKDKDDKIWVMPHSIFHETVLVHGIKVDRFEFLGRF